MLLVVAGAIALAFVAGLLIWRPWAVVAPQPESLRLNVTLGAGVPLLASNVGGIPEIIAPSDRNKVCFEPHPEILADRIRNALKEGAFSAHPSESFADTERKWVQWHGGLLNRANNGKPSRRGRRTGEESI